MDLFLAAHERGWRSPKHRQQWRNTLRDYVLPAIGETPVGAVDTGAVTKIIEPLWRTKTETASRVRGRIEAVLDYAKARGWREGENPAAGAAISINSCPPEPRCSASSITRRSTGARSARSWRGSGG